MVFRGFLLGWHVTLEILGVLQSVLGLLQGLEILGLLALGLHLNPGVLDRGVPCLLIPNQVLLGLWWGDPLFL